MLTLLEKSREKSRVTLVRFYTEYEYAKIYSLNVYIIR